jgi:hypothetical protein
MNAQHSSSFKNPKSTFNNDQSSIDSKDDAATIEEWISE